MMRRVYMADLRHDYGGVLSTDCMPLSVGYMKAVMDRDLPPEEVQASIFAYPSDLLEAMIAHPPDVLMVSNYVWNEALSLFFLRRAKALSRATLTVMGGPNIPVEPHRQIEFVSSRPEIDLYVLGEGDFVARDVVARFLEAGGLVEAMGEREIPSAIYRQPDGTLTRTEPPSRIRGRDINDIPSPWLTGIMDEFFDGKLAPIIETNRGCPFRCSFCVQGTGYYTKVTKFDVGRLGQEVEYIASRIRERSPNVGTLRIADANYGMYDRDTELSGFIGKAQRDYGWPTFIDATTGKNRADNIIRSMEQVNGALVLYQAVQSLDEEVLRNVRRSNIKLEAYGQMQVHVRGRGLRSSTDLILGLPGESLHSHLDALHRMIDLGVDQAHCFQAMLLKGADMESLATRREFKFRSRFRVLPKNFGEYGGEKVFDVEEIVVETDTLPFEDYVQCRKHHLTFSVFWNDSWFADVVALARSLGVKPSEWLSAMLEAMEEDDGPVGRFLADFVSETKGELFESRESCVAFYGRPESFERLCRGEIGDNLMYKYRAIASFFLWEEICRLALEATARLLEARGALERIPGFHELWIDLHRYVETKHATGTDLGTLLRPVDVVLGHEIDRWLKDGAPLDARPYRLDPRRTFRFRLSPEGARELESALAVWTARTIGLSKLVTRIKVTAQVRSCERKEDEPLELPSRPRQRRSA
jgi:radical SAM superfamily enzyme YgiQ (UPF0313 family)